MTSSGGAGTHDREEAHKVAALAMSFYFVDILSLHNKKIVLCLVLVFEVLFTCLFVYYGRGCKKAGRKEAQVATTTNMKMHTTLLNY